jgi:hypothetical protein
LEYDIIIKNICTIIIKSLFIIDSSFEDGEQLHFSSRKKVFSRIKAFSNIYRFGDKHDFIFNQIISILVKLDENETIKKLIIVKKNKNKFSKNIFLKFNLNYSCDFSSKIYLNISFIPFRLVSEEYLMGSSYLTLSFIYKKSINQKDINRLDYNCVLQASKFAYKIDVKASNIFKEIFNKNDRLNSQSMFIDELQLNIACLKEELLLLIKKEKTLKDNFFENEDFLDSDEEKAFNELNKEASSYFGKNKKKIIILRKEINSSISNLNNVVYQFITNKIIDLNQTIYIAYYYDFRGRIYPRSVLGPTYNKYIRLILYNNIKLTKIQILEILNSNYFKKYFIQIGNTYNLIIDKESYSLDNNKLSPFKKYIISHYLLEIGKINKVSLLKGEEFISLNFFINEGIKIINSIESNYNDFSLIEIFEIKKFIYIIKENLITNSLHYTILNKDATASSLQHWSIILGFKDKEILTKLNLNSKY